MVAVWWSDGLYSRMVLFPVHPSLAQYFLHSCIISLGVQSVFTRRQSVTLRVLSYLYLPLCGYVSALVCIRIVIALIFALRLIRKPACIARDWSVFSASMDHDWRSPADGVGSSLVGSCYFWFVLALRLIPLPFHHSWSWLEPQW